MIKTNITDFRKNIFNLLELTIKYNEPVNITTKEGNAVMISEEDYNGLIKTMYLTSASKQKEKFIKGLKTPLDDCLSETEVHW